MEIVHIAAELSPIAKVGGLGDVVLGLSRALIEKGHHVEIILPKYDTLVLSEIENLRVVDHDLSSYFEGDMHHNKVWKASVYGVEIILIEPDDPYGFFERGTIYGCPDDALRFAYFSRAALEYLQKTKRKIDILHLHDWHASLVAPLFHELYDHSHVVLTIHNLAYQGKCLPETLEKIGLKEHVAFKLQDEQNPLEINLLKGGILYSDAVTTVSPTYASEILAMKEPLSVLLQKESKKFSGILNGIDYHYWNPERDHYLPTHFSVKALEGKRKLQAHLRQMLSLADDESPIVSAITRLVPQKGPELIKHALYRTLEKGGQFILLGSAHDPMTHEIFYNLKRKLAGSAHVHLELSYNEKLSHLVFAASDLFLIPSLFEPCGLTQLIAMRYGALPLARLTGGLADTVFDGINGFTFEEPTPVAINEAIDRAFECWNKEPEKWHSMVKKAMHTDHSWNAPADEYVKLYERINVSNASR